MENPIQYLNTDNPSQMGGWVCQNSGGFVTTTYRCEKNPWGFHNGKAFVVCPLEHTTTGGDWVNENFTPGLRG